MNIFKNSIKSIIILLFVFIFSFNCVASDSFFLYSAPSITSYKEMYDIRLVEDFNVDEDSLNTFSNLFKNLEEGSKDTTNLGLNLVSVDEDLEFLYILLLDDDGLIDTLYNLSQDDGNESFLKYYDYLSTFYDKYPIIKIRKGYVDFYTFQNKKELLLSLSEYDYEIISYIVTIYNEERFKKLNISKRKENEYNLKWATNMHDDITRYAAYQTILDGKSPLTESQINIISGYAGYPDEIDNFPLNHYCGYALYTSQTFFLNKSAEKALEYSNLSKNKTDPFRNLGMGTHYVGDVMNPLHTSLAVVQGTDFVCKIIEHLSGYFYNTLVSGEITEFKFDQYTHNVYEEHVYYNWTQGLNYRDQYINFTGRYDVTNAYEASILLADYTSEYGPSLFNAVCNNDQYTIQQITLDCLREGKKYLSGYIEYSKPRFSIVDVVSLFQYLNGVGAYADLSEYEMVQLGFDYDNNGCIDVVDVKLMLAAI